MHLFEAATEKDYHARLCVEGNRIITYLDGVKYCDHLMKSAVPDKLYYSAVCENKDIIIKAANMEAKEKELLIDVNNKEITEAVMYCLEDIPLDAKNSFEEPQKISPKQRTLPIINGKIAYLMKKHSFVVIRMR